MTLVARTTHMYRRLHGTMMSSVMGLLRVYHVQQHALDMYEHADDAQVRGQIINQTDLQYTMETSQYLQRDAFATV